MLSENYSHLLAFLNRSNNFPDKKNNRKSSSFFFFYRFLNHFWSYSFDRKWGNVRSTLRLYRNESSPPTCSGHTTLHHLRNYAASLNRSWNKSEMLQFRKWNKDKTYWSCFQAWMKKKKSHISPVACSATHATHLSGCEFLTLPGFSSIKWNLIAFP